MSNRCRLGRGMFLFCMKTRSRKRVKASSSVAPSNNPTTARTSKRPCSSAVSFSDTPVTSCTHQASFAFMDSEHAPGHDSNSDKNIERDKYPPSDKGKERELLEGSSRTREKEREAKRVLGLSFASVDADDDNNSEGGAGILHQNFMSAGCALQGLLRKLGARLDNLLPSSVLLGSSSQQSSRLKKILSGLRADGEEGRQMEALT